MPGTDKYAVHEDYPLGKVPPESRKSLFSIATVLLGFTFFTSTMWGGAKLGVAFDFKGLLGIIILGDLLLGSYVAILGIFIPPIGGVIIADFFYKHRGNYPEFSNVKLARFNYSGIFSYVIASAAAFFAPGIPPINGIITAILSYIVIDIFLDFLGFRQEHTANIS